MSIEQVIQQRRFESLAQRSAINLTYTAMLIGGKVTQKLKPFSMTSQQFNAMRIIRGQKGKPASVKLIAERMIDPSSNASRIVDKLVSKQWVERKQCPADRRQVDIRLTESGADILQKASAAVAATLDQVFSQLSSKDHEQLNEFLDQLHN